ncbi:MAG: mannose-1-phosphate guanylyltransferase/mannose-6-phosphate isomerase [Gammaproteobacteria bacterium]|nr:mannose-1-phosphate guanylyltransferase/mannose-6-phosphate isomerase [Gammaproteobacteria bacterium]
MIPVILSGGTGTRLWPLSRAHRPKQFFRLVNDQSMFQNTINRLGGLSHIEPPLVICNLDHRFLVAEQLHEISQAKGQILLEPIGRNTAPAIVAAALWSMQVNETGNESVVDPILFVLPADHDILDSERFHQAIAIAERHAQEGALVTFGVVPNRVETGYGYIQAVNSEQTTDDIARPVKRFVEKPDYATAESYVASGDYYWNSGMFMFRASVLLEEMEKFAPEIVKCVSQAVKRAAKEIDFNRLDAEAFGASPADSIDYAVMEKTDKAVVVPLDAQWNDVGSWTALWEIGEQNAENNVIYGDVYTHDVKNCYIRAETNLVAGVGLDGLIIVETPDGIMIADKERAQDIKHIVDKLKSDKRCEVVHHRKVYRPWGHYDSIDIEDTFQVKRILINPGSSISLQKHFHRSEHWIVVSGTAEITRGDETFILTINQSTYIPLGTVHRLRNPGKIPLEIVEVQSGSYLGEDDIVRIEDEYGREREETG